MPRPVGIHHTSHMRAFSQRCALVIAVALLGGCATNSKNVTEPGAAAIAVRQELEKSLGRVQSQPGWSGGAEARAPRPDFTSDSISLAWQGDAAVLLSEVARQRLLKFNVTGPQPRLPIYIFVNSTSQTYVDLLGDIDKQFGQRANVVLGDDYLELRYR